MEQEGRGSAVPKRARAKGLMRRITRKVMGTNTILFLETLANQEPEVKKRSPQGLNPNQSPEGCHNAL